MENEVVVFTIILAYVVGSVVGALMWGAHRYERGVSDGWDQRERHEEWMRKQPR